MVELTLPFPSVPSLEEGIFKALAALDAYGRAISATAKDMQQAYRRTSSG